MGEVVHLRSDERAPAAATLSRITLRVARAIASLPAMTPTVRELAIRRLIRQAIEEAIGTLPAAELLPLLEDRERFYDGGRRP